MLDLRAEIRQSRGDVKPRNCRGRCQKTTTSRRVDPDLEKLDASFVVTDSAWQKLAYPFRGWRTMSQLLLQILIVVAFGAFASAVATSLPSL
jgi:hypothetical protein